MLAQIEIQLRFNPAQGTI